MFNQEEYKLWSAIPELRKQEILSAAIGKLLNVARQQIAYINNWKEVDNDDTKSARHVYVFSTIENFWENIELVLHFGRDRFSHFSFYPVRTCMETFLQFHYFAKQSIEEQDNLSIKELLRSSIRYYKRAVDAGEDPNIYKSYYDSHASIFAYPQINKVKKEDDAIKTFPGIRKLCENYLPQQASILHFLYQVLCEGVHGRGIYYTIHQQAKVLEEYRRTMMQVYGFCKNILLVLDKVYFKAYFKNQVLSAIIEADRLIKESIKS